MIPEASKIRWIALGFMVVALLACSDQWTKREVFELLEAPETELVPDEHGSHHLRLPLVGRWLAFMSSCNKGAAFGQFDDFPHILVGGRVLAILLLSWLLFRSDHTHRAVFWAMVLVLGGALGNLIDNLWTGCAVVDHPYAGVRDFIDVWFVPLGWDYHFPSFNVADSCISVGAVLWVVSGLFHRTEEPEDETQEAVTEEPPATGA